MLLLDLKAGIAVAEDTDSADHLLLAFLLVEVAVVVKDESDELAGAAAVDG